MAWSKPLPWRRSCYRSTRCFRTDPEHTAAPGSFAAEEHRRVFPQRNMCPGEKQCSFLPGTLSRRKTLTRSSTLYLSNSCARVNLREKFARRVRTRQGGRARVRARVRVRVRACVNRRVARRSPLGLEMGTTMSTLVDFFWAKLKSISYCCIKSSQCSAMQHRS